MPKYIALFPFDSYWWFYPSFSVFVLLLLLVDLGVFHRKAHSVSLKEAGIWSAVWASLAALFNVALYFYAAWRLPQVERLTSSPGFDAALAAKRVSLEFLAGYIVELSLSVDNLFVFIVVFNFFAIPAAYQHRILFYGILGAIILRGVFIAVGTALMQIHWIIYVFGGFLLVTGIRMMFADDKEIDPDRNPVIRLFKRWMPVTTTFEGQRFFVKVNGVLHATPLLVTLLFVEMTDVVFAVDSVPAILALTREPLIVFTSNVFAILGLRSMYFLLAGAADKFHLLKYGLAIVLIFVGLKMVWLNQAFGGQFPIGWSLTIIAVVIGGSVVLSLLVPKRQEELVAPRK
ncbi:MAG: TerC family protein [Bryobacteraceae bacterium]